MTITFNTVFGLRAYEEITFASVAGMTDLNGTFAIVSVSGSDVVVPLTTTQTYSFWRYLGAGCATQYLGHDQADLPLGEQLFRDRVSVRCDDHCRNDDL